MGTISDKLIYLNTTKTMLRDSLNKFGSNISDNDTFRSYCNVLNDIYDKLPTVTGNGSEFTLTPVQNGQVDDFKIIGTDLEQDTTTGKNLFDKDNINVLNAYFTADSPIITSSYSDRTIYIPCSPNTTYTVSKKTSGYRRAIGYTTNIPEIGDTVDGIVHITQNYTSGTITTGSNANYLLLRAYNSGQDANTSFTQVANTIQIEEGSYETSYEPYTGGIPSPNPDYPQEIKVVEGRQVIADNCKNLFDKEHEITGYVYDSSGNLVDSPNWNTNDEFKQVNENKISFSCKTTNSINCLLIEFNSNKVFIRRQQSTVTSKVFTLDSNTKYIRFCYLNNAGMYDIQIEEDSTATDYEPYYNPVSYNIDLNLENIYLAKIPNTDYKNRIYKNNGNWYFEKNVEKYIIDGTESWTTQSAYSGYYRYMFVLMENYKNDNLSYGVVGMNSHFIQRITQPHGDYEYLYLQAANNNLLSVYIQIKNLSTIANFKTWLSENNVVVWYVLANPITTQITNTTLINQLEAISTFKGTNIFTISNDNNIIPEIEITRLKELEKLA